MNYLEKIGWVHGVNIEIMISPNKKEKGQNDLNLFFLVMSYSFFSDAISYLFLPILHIFC